jgi:predicted nucleic acid-binding protein
VILFCDTSALIKLYVDEDQSDRMKVTEREADMIGVCRIAYAEAMAAFSRRQREEPSDAALIEKSKHKLSTDWNEFVVVEITQPLVELAADLAETFALRGYDSVQLAGARTLQQTAGESLQFACFDQRLSKAAAVLGMQTL